MKNNNIERFLMDINMMENMPDNQPKEKETPKQNMTLPGFTTTKDLDLQLESILKSIEPDIMKAVEKIMPKSN